MQLCRTNKIYKYYLSAITIITENATIKKDQSVIYCQVQVQVKIINDTTEEIHSRLRGGLQE